MTQTNDLFLYSFISFNRNIPETAGPMKGEQEGNVVIDDIETMLANLSTQLDAMLEQEITPGD